MALLAVRTLLPLWPRRPGALAEVQRVACFGLDPPRDPRLGGPRELRGLPGIGEARSLVLDQHRRGGAGGIPWEALHGIGPRIAGGIERALAVLGLSDPGRLQARARSPLVEHPDPCGTGVGSVRGATVDSPGGAPGDPADLPCPGRGP